MIFWRNKTKKSKLYRYKDLLKKKLKDPEFRKEYEKLGDEFKLASQLIKLRVNANLTQKELAQKIGTSQPAIARLESGQYKDVSLAFLRRISGALGTVPEIHFKKV